MEEKVGEKLRCYVIKCFTYDWIFSHWYEKLIIVGLVAFATYKFVRLLI